MLKSCFIESNGRKKEVNAELYNTASEVVNDCRKRSITDSSFSNMQVDLGGHDADWCGVSSYEQALDYLENGYQPIVDKLKVLIRANVMGEGKRISFHNDIVGYAPIVPLAVLGVPNSMINSHMKTIKAKVLDVYYDNTFYAGTSSDDIIKTGSSIISAIISLEQQGYRFNLHALQCYCGNGSADILSVKLKDATQPVDLKRMSFALAHTGFFRVIGFDWYSKTPNGKYRGSYGHTIDREFGDEGAKDVIKTLFGKNAFYISGSNLLRKGDKEKYLKEMFTSGSNKN